MQSFFSVSSSGNAVRENRSHIIMLCSLTKLKTVHFKPELVVYGGCVCVLVHVFKIVV